MKALDLPKLERDCRERFGIGFSVFRDCTGVRFDDAEAFLRDASSREIDAYLVFFHGLLHPPAPTEALALLRDALQVPEPAVCRFCGGEIPLEPLTGREEALCRLYFLHAACVALRNAFV